MLKLQGRVMATGLRFPEGPVALPDGSRAGGGDRAPVGLTRVLPDGALEGRRTGSAAVPTARPSAPTGTATSATTAASLARRDDGLTRPTGQAEDYTGGSIERVDLATGTVETLYTHCDGVQLRGPNDIVFDAQGGF